MFEHLCKKLFKDLTCHKKNDYKMTVKFWISEQEIWLNFCTRKVLRL